MDDGFNNILFHHMMEYEEKLCEDGADEVLNHHMDEYESCGGIQYTKINIFYIIILFYIMIIFFIFKYFYISFPS